MLRPAQNLSGRVGPVGFSGGPGPLLTPSIITAEMNDQLSTQFLAWEVQKEINQMAPLKAPGLDDMPPIFFQI